MKKKCEDFMDRFFMLDKNQRLPFAMTIHLLTCRECRSQVRRLTLFEKKCQKENLKKISIDSEGVTNIMLRLNDECERLNIKKQKVSLKKWVLAGALLFCCLLFVELMTVFASASDYMVFHFSLFFALSVIVYCGFFVAANMDFFIKKWKIQ